MGIAQSLSQVAKKAKEGGVRYAKRKAGEEYHLSIFAVTMFAAVMSDLLDLLPAIGTFLALFIKPIIAFMIWKHGDFKSRVWRIILLLLDTFIGFLPITSLTVAYVWYSAAKKERENQKKKRQLMPGFI